MCEYVWDCHLKVDHCIYTDDLLVREDLYCHTIVRKFNQKMAGANLDQLKKLHSSYCSEESFSESDSTLVIDPVSYKLWSRLKNIRSIMIGFHSVLLLNSIQNKKHHSSCVFNVIFNIFTLVNILSRLISSIIFE